MLLELPVCQFHPAAYSLPAQPCVSACACSLVFCCICMCAHTINTKTGTATAAALTSSAGAATVAAAQSAGQMEMQSWQSTQTASAATACGVLRLLQQWAMARSECAAEREGKGKGGVDDELGQADLEGRDELCPSSLRPSKHRCSR